MGFICESMIMMGSTCSNSGQIVGQQGAKGQISPIVGRNCWGMGVVDG